MYICSILVPWQFDTPQPSFSTEVGHLSKSFPWHNLNRLELIDITIYQWSQSQNPNTWIWMWPWPFPWCNAGRCLGDSTCMCPRLETKLGFYSPSARRSPELRAAETRGSLRAGYPQLFSDYHCHAGPTLSRSWNGKCYIFSRNI